MNATGGHALMSGLNHDRHAPRFQHILDGVCDLRRQLFLNLQSLE